MAMKKKFLGLAMAAMVALPATSVYAWDKNGDILSGNDSDIMTQDVTVTGEVKSNQGTVAEGRLEVILPTSMAFSIDQKGKFTNVDYKVTNNSPTDISVGVQQFRETIANGGITLKDKNATSQMDSLPRNNVQMALVGDNGSGTTKRYVDLGDPATQNLTSTQPLIDVKPKQTGIIQLLGNAGKSTSDETEALQKGMTEKFTVVFEVKKKD